jgi:hypothetical protein
MDRLRIPTLWCRLFFVSAILLVSSATTYPQTASAVSGRWIWKQVARKNKPQTQFTIVINRKGDVVSGTYSVDEFINGKWQGEDGNQTPFLGRVKGSTVEIEFDPSATVAGYEQNVTYSPPTDGRKPSTAVITLNGPTLQWRLVTGPGIDGLPAKLVLKREHSKPKR